MSISLSLSTFTVCVQPIIFRKDLAKPYDPKKAVWIPDGNGGFIEGMIQVGFLINVSFILLPAMFRVMTETRPLSFWGMRTSISNLNRFHFFLDFPYFFNRLVQ